MLFSDIIDPGFAIAISTRKILGITILPPPLCCVSSGLTDFADGFIARHFNMVTELGKAIDPVADKLSGRYRHQPDDPHRAYACWPFLRRQGAFYGHHFYWAAEKHNTKMDGAKWSGKVSTFVFYTVMFIISFPSLSILACGIF